MGASKRLVDGLFAVWVLKSARESIHEMVWYRVRALWCVLPVAFRKVKSFNCYVHLPDRLKTKAAPWILGVELLLILDLKE